MNRMAIVLTIATAALAGSAAPALAGEKDKKDPVYDEELIVSKLQESAQPLSEALRKQTLPKAYEQAIEVLNGTEPDRVDHAIGIVLKGLDEFLADEDRVCKKLWDGMDVFARVTQNLRKQVAKSMEKGNSMTAIPPQAEKRLKDIATLVDREKDPTRKAQLKLLFRTSYQIANIQAALPNLTPAQQRLYTNTLQVLQGVETRFHELVYAAHVSYTSLRMQRDFLRDHQAFNNDLTSLQHLVDWVAGKGGGQESWKSLADNMAGLQDGLSQLTGALAENQEDMVAALEDSVEEGIGKITPDSMSVDDAELDALVARYAHK